MQRCPSRRLLLFPQLFWTSLVLLRTASTALYARTVRLLLLVLRKLDVRDGSTQAVLLAAAPSGAAAAEAGEEAGQVRGLEALLMPLLYGGGGGTSAPPHDAPPTTGAVRTRGGAGRTQGLVDTSFKTVHKVAQMWHESQAITDHSLLTPSPATTVPAPMLLAPSANPLCRPLCCPRLLPPLTAAPMPLLPLNTMSWALAERPGNLGPYSLAPTHH